MYISVCIHVYIRWKISNIMVKYQKYGRYEKTVLNKTNF